MSLKEKKYYSAKSATNLKQAIENLSSLLFPKICAGCESWTPMTGDILCLKCKAKLCHAPNNQDLLESLIESKGWTDQYFDFYTSLYIFEKESIVQKLLYQIKYKNRKDLAHCLGRRLGTLLYQNAKRNTVLIPVPMHPEKLKKRGYNQAEEVAKGIKQVMKSACIVRMLDCLQNKQSQTTQSKEERWTELEGVFRINQEERTNKPGHLILVDDVITTGATMQNCATELFREMQPKTLSLATVAIAV